MRVLVVGLGAAGAMAAWRLAAEGHQVVGLEQFRVDHDRGSSYGESRIVRRVYPNRMYTGLMERAYALWDTLMDQSADPELFVRCGGLFFGPAGHPEIAAAEAALRDSRVEYERIDARECMRRFPAFDMQDTEIALYEPSMGYGRASRAVRAAVALARRSGSTIREETRVSALEPAGDGVLARLDSGEVLEADRLVITAGPWTAPLLRPLDISLPLTITRQPYVHLTPARDEQTFEADLFPVWIDAEVYAYGFPRLGDAPGVKIGIHNMGIATNPETVDRSVTDIDRDAVRSYANRRFPSLGPDVACEKVCLYSVTPDNDFIIDTVPGLSCATLISACSGHGFKFAPLLGQIAADLVTGRDKDYDISAFRLSRFAGND